MLVPQEGLGAGAPPVLLANFAAPVGGWRYELERREDGRVVYVWAQDERPPFDYEAVFDDGPAEGYRMHILGLTEPQPYYRLAPNPQARSHMPWIHLPWMDTPPWDGEVFYELTGTLVPPRGQGDPQAHYRHIPEAPWSKVTPA